MAGGENARVVPCFVCTARAERTSEGIEDDEYLCEEGHTFGIDWSYGQPSVPQWPASAEDLAVIAEMKRMREEAGGA